MLSVRKLLIVPKKKGKEDAKAKRLIEVNVAKERLVIAEVPKSTCVCLAYDLFCKLLVEDPEVQWDCIVTNMHTKNLWMAINGEKHNCLCLKSKLSLNDSIEFHKLTVFTMDAAERLKYYLTCSIKKPMRWTIRQHISHD